MTEEAADLWRRAEEALTAAAALRVISPDGAASRAYYAAFNAVSALMVEEGQSFTKHSAVEAAVHRELVRTGRFSTEDGRAYSRLVAWRQIGDYGGGRHVQPEQADEAIAAARHIHAAVSALLPGG